MNQNHFKELFNYPIKEFIQHLEAVENERILFSGKFGIGKTSFIRNFFSTETQTRNFKQAKYIPTYLFPVNYSVSTNEDIIRYIKYDIVIELIKKDIPVEKISLAFIDTLPSYARKNALKIIASFLSFLPKIGKDLSDIYNKLENLQKEFLKYHDTLTETQEDKMISYLETLEHSEGNIYENDIITKSIAASIEKLKEGGLTENSELESKDEREAVLIIDDLDRLDPEHVFRLFNVFASHFDNYEKHGKKNKFGFDKVLFVCDIMNIRNIFYHKYGANVDFNGYIDKFYSSEVYQFDNREAIKSIVINVLSETNIVAETAGEENFVKKELLSAGDFLSEILILCLQTGAINLRSIIKLRNKAIGYHREELVVGSKNLKFAVWKLPILLHLRFLRDIFGDYHHLKKAFEVCSISHQIPEYYKTFFPPILYILAHQKHRFYGRQEFEYTYEELLFRIKVHENSGDVYQISLTLPDGIATEIPSANNDYPSPKSFWKACLEAIEILHEKGFLK